MNSRRLQQPIGLRKITKAIVFALAFAFTAALVVISWLEKRLNRGEALFLLFGQSLAVAPGFIGRYLRGAYYCGTLDRCSWETHIGFGSLFIHRGAVIGPRVSLGAYCVIGHAHIGEGVMMGSRVSVPSGKRQHLDEAGRLASTTQFDTVVIGPGTWVGEGAIIMAHVGTHCIVSAGAVVAKDMPDGTLIAGNPAQAVRSVAVVDGTRE